MESKAAESKAEPQAKGEGVGDQWSARAQAKDADASSSRRAKVMLAEDNDFNAECIGMFLEVCCFV